MRYLILIIITILAAAVQTTLSDLLEIGPVAPDWLALTAMLWIIETRDAQSVLSAAAVGMVQDACSPGRIGPAMAAFAITAWLLISLRSRFSSDGLMPRLLLMTAGLILAESLLWLFVLREQSVILSLGTALYTAFFALPFLLVIAWLGNKFHNDGVS